MQTPNKRQSMTGDPINAVGLTNSCEKKVFINILCGTINGRSWCKRINLGVNKIRNMTAVFDEIPSKYTCIPVSNIRINLHL